MEISEKLAELHKQLASLTETVAVLQKEVTGEAASKGNHQQNRTQHHIQYPTAQNGLFYGRKRLAAFDQLAG